MDNIRSVDSDCVVFNWECCWGYNDKSFPEGSEIVFDFLNTILDKGHMAMFSDFSLKALITRWSEKRLGPNPFRLISSTSDPIDLRFKAELLK